MIRPQPGPVGIPIRLALFPTMLRAFTRAADPTTARPRVNAVSAGWPRRSATTAAQRVSTGARLISRGMVPAKPEVGALARDGNLRSRDAKFRLATNSNHWWS
jgi:hypothetical protein